jgi:hypothetical protein
MSESQPLGGTRHSSPLADEMTYPLTNDEFLTIKENLTQDKLTNLESLLISTFFATLVSGIVIYFTGNFTKKIIEKGIELEIINFSQIIILIVYGALTLGSLIGFIISKKIKKKSRTSIERLNIKIEKHLENL